MRINMLLLASGLVAVAAGIGWLFPPAGVITAGVGLAAFGLLRDDGKPKK